MKRTPKDSPLSTRPYSDPQESKQSTPSRRKFLGRIGTATLAGGVLGSASPAWARTGDGSHSGTDSLNADTGTTTNRAQQALNIRSSMARRDAALPVPPHTTNGDEQRYSDHSASYSKVVLQDDICVVNPAAWASFKRALNSGKNSDFEAIIIGGTRTLNGPQGSYAFDLESADSSLFGDAPDVGDPTGPRLVPPFDHVTSEAYGTQLVELYWASLMRDLAFTDFPGDSTAVAAAAELNSMTSYRGPRNSKGNVTPDLLFRGNFPGETVGPYISQMMITPTSMGQEPMSMLCTTYLPAIDYMQDTTTFLQVQNGISTGLSDQNDPTLRYLRDFRDLRLTPTLTCFSKLISSACSPCQVWACPRTRGIRTPIRGPRTDSAPLVYPILPPQPVRSPRER